MNHFKDTYAWEKCKLGELGKTISGTGFPDKEQGNKNNSDTPFFKVSDMNNLGNENSMVNSNNYVTKEQIARNKWQPINALPAIIFAKVGAAVFLNRKRLVVSPFLIDNNMMAYCINPDLDMDFMKNLFENINLPRYAQTGALPSYNGSDIQKIEVCITRDVNEQKQIGKLLDKVDKLLVLHKSQADHYQELKKALLQQMFV